MCDLKVANSGVDIEQSLSTFWVSINDKLFRFSQQLLGPYKHFVSVVTMYPFSYFFFSAQCNPGGFDCVQQVL